MIDDANDALAHHFLAEIDEQITRDAADLAQQALDAGWLAEDLPVILRPWLQSVAAVRARAIARLQIDRADWHVASVH